MNRNGKENILVVYSRTITSENGKLGTTNVGMLSFDRCTHASLASHIIRLTTPATVHRLSARQDRTILQVIAEMDW